MQRNLCLKNYTNGLGHCALWAGVFRTPQNSFRRLVLLLLQSFHYWSVLVVLKEKTVVAVSVSVY